MMDGLLQAKVAIITGAASGIGAATTQTFAEAGASVVLFDINRDMAENISHTLKLSGGQAAFYQVDMTDADSVAEAVEQVHETFGRIDIIVNVAGGSGRRRGMALSRTVRWKAGIIRWI